MGNATHNARIKVPINYNDRVLLDTRSSAGDVSALSLKPNLDGGGGGAMQINQVGKVISSQLRVTTFATWNARFNTLDTGQESACGERP